MDATPLTSGEAEQRALQSRVICILWTAPDAVIDPELERSLKRWQGLVVTECRSAPAAIAEVMSIERAMRSGKREPTVLLLVEPERLLGVTDVLTAIDRYSSTTRSWCFVPNSPEMLRAVTPADIMHWTRLAADRARAAHPERAPQISVVASSRPPRAEVVMDRSSRRLSAQPPTETFSPHPPVRLELADTAAEHPSSIERPVDPDFPDLHIEGDAYKGFAGDAAIKSDNSDKPTAKWGGGVSNVLTPDEMAMLLADEDGRAHT